MVWYLAVAYHPISALTMNPAKTFSLRSKELKQVQDNKQHRKGWITSSNVFNVGPRDLFCERPFPCSYVFIFLIGRPDLDFASTGGAEEEDGSKAAAKGAAEDVKTVFLFPLGRPRGF